MGRGNSRAELVDWLDWAEVRRQAAATDCDISLPEVRSTEILRAGDLTHVGVDALVFGGSQAMKRLDHRGISRRRALILRHGPDVLAVVTSVVVYGGRVTQALQVGARLCALRTRDEDVFHSEHSRY
jgi:hypothetical protein